MWIAVLKAQRDLGMHMPAEAIEAYERTKEQVDLASIRRREAATRHDVKAKIEEFCDLAGHEQIHKGMTSRDLTDNVEQFQVLKSLQLIAPKYVHLLDCLSRRSREWQDLSVVGRTHHAAAQPTTMGNGWQCSARRWCSPLAARGTDPALSPARMQGAVGTGLDQLTLFEGDVDKLSRLQQKVLTYLGFRGQLVAVGQIYPRSLDFDVISCLYQLGEGALQTWRARCG